MIASTLPYIVSAEDSTAFPSTCRVLRSLITAIDSWMRDLAQDGSCIFQPNHAEKTESKLLTTGLTDEFTLRTLGMPQKIGSLCGNECFFWLVQNIQTEAFLNSTFGIDCALEGVLGMTLCLIEQALIVGIKHILLKVVWRER